MNDLQNGVLRVRAGTHLTRTSGLFAVKRAAAIPNSFLRKFAKIKSLPTLHVLVICICYRVGKAYLLTDLVISRFKAYKVLRVLLFQALDFRLSKPNLILCIHEL